MSLQNKNVKARKTNNNTEHTFAYSNGVSIIARHVPAIIPPKTTRACTPFVKGISYLPIGLSKYVYLKMKKKKKKNFFI
jgi:hypothetical protein